MAKRRPGSELNDRNWDVEEEPEEAGVFNKASTDVMQQRIIKKAKRHTQSDSNETKKGVFSGFGGLTKTTQAKSNPSNGSGTLFSPKPPALSFASSSNGTEEEKESPEDYVFLESLKALNESVLDWIKQHVEKNPYIVLSPIFEDYNNHMAKLEAKKSISVSNTDGASGDPQSTFSSFKKEELSDKSNDNGCNSSEEVDKPYEFGASAVSEPKSKGVFSFGSTNSSSTNGGFKFSTTSPSTGFSFGKSDSQSTKETEQKKSFSFGLSGAASAKETEEKKPFSFGLSGAAGSKESEEKKPFSFGLSGSSQGSGLFGATGSTGGASSQSNKDDEEYVPPKPEVKEIKEDDALYSIRCKLYYQKEGSWTERGVGNLHLKPVAETKTQLLIRADTNLGNILLNVMLSATIPASRQGKNNVFLVCVPNPPISGKPDAESDDTPTPMLIRVKTAEDADELLGKIDERKKLLS